MSDLSRRDFLVKSATSAAIAAVATAHVMAAKKAMAARLRGAGAANSAPAVTSITIVRTGTKYALIREAVAAAIAGDEILIPAGTYAPDYPQYPYAYWDHLNWSASGTGDHFDNMYLYNSMTFTGVGTANNGRARIEMPHCVLTSDVPANTLGPFTLQVDSTALFPTLANSYGYMAIAPSLLNSGGRALWAPPSGQPMYLSSTTPNTSTTITIDGGSSPSVDMPAGTILRMMCYNQQALFAPASPDPGVTFNNLEMLDTLQYNDGAGYANGRAVFQLTNYTYGGNGSYVLNGCAIHDCQLGPDGAGTTPGLGSFIHIYDTELYQMGDVSALTHNVYIPPVDEFILMGCYSHLVDDVHLVKTRARSNYILYNRITGERSDFSDPNESCCIDFSQGGLCYVIGNVITQSLYPSNVAINFAAEGAFNPIQEIYCINNTILASPNGYGWNPHLASPFPGYSYQALSTPTLGPGPADTLVLGQSVAGALPARTYYGTASIVNSGGETQITVSQLTAGGGGNGGIPGPNFAVSANNVLTAASPATGTGKTGWNFYQAYLDPVVYPPNVYNPSADPSLYFWDSGLTQHIVSQASGGALPAADVIIAFTYQFGSLESINAGMVGNGFYESVCQSLYFLTTANEVCTFASPPSVPGATGWNVYASTFGAITNYAAGGPLVKQNATPIAIGTPWTEPTSGWLKFPATWTLNWYKQNTSPIAIGTNWTEPTSGIVNNNPTKLAWKLRDCSEGGSGLGYWYAVAPTNLTGYVIDMVSFYQPNNFTVFRVSGVTGFDPNASLPAFPNGSTGSIATTDATTLVFTDGAQPSGWTAIGPNSLWYKTFSSPQGSLSLPSSFLGDAVTGSGLAINGSPVTTATAGFNAPPGQYYTQITIDATAGDYIFLFVNGFYGANAIDSLYPVASDTFADSPAGLFDNNICEYFNVTPNGGFVSPATGYVTVGANNVHVNYSTANAGPPVTFNTPHPFFVNEANYDFHLTSSSTALIGHANSAPGSSPEGYSLKPTYQISIIGLPAFGTPIPALVARADCADVGGLKY